MQDLESLPSKLRPINILKVITSFDYLKKIVLKSPEFWSSKKEHLHGTNEIISTNFNFRDYFKAFKVDQMIITSFRSLQRSVIEMLTTPIKSSFRCLSSI